MVLAFLSTGTYLAMFVTMLASHRSVTRAQTTRARETVVKKKGTLPGSHSWHACRAGSACIIFCWDTAIVVRACSPAARPEDRDLPPFPTNRPSLDVAVQCIPTRCRTSCARFPCPTWRASRSPAAAPPPGGSEAGAPPAGAAGSTAELSIFFERGLAGVAVALISLPTCNVFGESQRVQNWCRQAPLGVL